MILFPFGELRDFDATLGGGALNSNRGVGDEARCDQSICAAWEDA